MHDENDGKNGQQSCLYHFTVWVGVKNFVKISGSDMKYNRNQNIPSGFVIEPIHDNNKRENTDQKIYPVNPACLNDITMVIAVYRR